MASDCLENYEIIEELGNSSVAIVRCKSWRFGARKIVLKKISRSTKLSLAQFSKAALIHQSLYHPSIVSLVSAFTSPDFHCQVLELCSGGSLSSLLRMRSVITEAELRSVAKGITEALSYLKKEQVVHRNISPSAVLLTSEGRVVRKHVLTDTPSKIVLESIRIRICISDSMSTSRFRHLFRLCCPVLSQSNHDGTADLWSLGCIMITCLTGKCPVSSSESTLRASLFTLRKDIPNVSRNLIINLVQINPDNRLPLRQILSHQFFYSSLPVVPLRPSLFYQAGETPLSDSKGPNVRQPLVTSGYTAPVVNTELRKLLNDELVGDSSRLGQRRIVSDPLPKPTETLASELSELNCTAKTPIYPSSLSKGRAPLLSDGINLKKRPQRSMSVSCTQSSETVTRVPSVTSSRPSVPKNFQNPNDRDHQYTETSIPVGTSRPTPLTTSLLTARAHKTVHGLITILPSRSLLVDFRESQRRNGEKGDQVLLIDPDGRKVKVYDAAHLSSPCCLAEASAEYDISELPSSYWKLYNDASVLVDRIKQRTPKLVLYEAEMKCTLMANGPEGNIEVLFLCLSDSSLCDKPVISKNQDNPRMRIRLFRQSRSIEIARSISGTQGKEWINKTIHTSGDGCSISAEDWERLEDDERKGIEETIRFVRICEAHERSGVSTKTKSSMQHEDSRKISKHPATHGVDAKQVSSSLTATTKVSSMPATKPFMPLVPSWNNLAFPENDSLRSDRAVGSCTFVDRENILSSSASASVETRFIPNVGWCLRHNSQVTQGGRYKIMFLDGATFDVDVDEEWIQYTSPLGQTSRHGIRETPTRDITERMKIFEEFILLFEDDT